MQRRTRKQRDPPVGQREESPDTLNRGSLRKKNTFRFQARRRWSRLSCFAGVVAVVMLSSCFIIFKDHGGNNNISQYLRSETTTKPKVYIHIGAPKTGTTSIQETLAMDKLVLKHDKFFLALHGQILKREDRYIVDNMLVACDRLGACVWSDEQRQRLAAYGSGVEAKCPEYLLPSFNEFLSKAIAANSSVVISNEWLIRPSSETGLLSILKGWDPIIVIYYRRFFDWLISAHYQWHYNINMSIVESFNGKVRLVDFIRRICAKLFSPNAVIDPHPLDDSEHLGFVNLVDVPEYTYQAWERYKAVPEYDRNNIKVVNFHDGDVVQSMYCEVLHAKHACKLETERVAKGVVKTRPKNSTAYMDLAMGVYWNERDLILNMDGVERGENITRDTFNEWADTLRERMDGKGYSEDDIPKECLTKREETLLLTVSLAYEWLLRADLYLSGGKEKSNQHFQEILGKGGFCSIDTEAVLKQSKWAFLFEKK